MMEVLLIQIAREGMRDAGNDHFTVNQKYNFVDDNTGYSKC